MDRRTIENQWLRDNKLFGQLIGTWPQQDRSTKYVIRVILTGLITVSNLAQIAQIIVFFNFDILLDQMPFLLLGISIYAKYYNYIFKEKQLQTLLNGIVSDWQAERTKEELQILNMYAERGLFFCSIYKASICFSVIAFILVPAVPPVLDIVAPRNVSRDRLLVYPSYYFVDQQQYYYPILGHMVVCAFILGCIFVACDINLIQIVQHGCGLVAVSGYRFKHALDAVNFHEEKRDDAISNETYKKVTRCIEAHKRADEYIKGIEACHVQYTFIVVGFIVMVFTVTLIKLTSEEIGTKYFTFCAFIVSQLVHVLFLTMMGQFIIDCNEEAFREIYEAHWYNAPAKTQALYVLVLRKCLKPRTLTGGGMIPLNLDTFLQLLKASFSYYTVLKSS